MVNLEASIQNKVHNLNVELEPLTQDIEVGMSCNIVYAFSPTVNITQLQNGNYLISITDKFGTTTAEVNNLNQETIDGFIKSCLEKNKIIENYFEEHSEQFVQKDYENLDNLPSIEGIPLVGDKTFAQLQMMRLTNSDIESLLQ